MAEAQSQADPRYNIKPLDRAGFSRAGEQRQLADIASAQNLAQGLANAYGQQRDDALFNATTSLGNLSSAEGAGLGLSGIAAQQQYANALASLQRQQAAQQMQGNLLGGLLGGGLTNFLGY